MQTNSQITDYIYNAQAAQKEIMEAIRQLIQESVPGVVEEFKWSRPVFKLDKEMAYLKTAKAYVTLGFSNAEKLSDPQNRLEGTGKDMRHVKLKSMQDIDRELFKTWFQTLGA
jgi:hypothetical protein